MTTIHKPGAGAPRGNQNARGNKGGRPRADTKNFNLTLPNPLYQQLENLRLEGYGTKSEILTSFMVAGFADYAARVRELSAGLVLT